MGNWDEKITNTCHAAHSNTEYEAELRLKVYGELDK